MATSKLITVSEKIITSKKNKPVTSMKIVKTDGTEIGAKKAIEKLQKEKSSYFEVLDKKNGTKTVYNRMLSGKNYEKKVVNI